MILIYATNCDMPITVIGTCKAECDIYAVLANYERFVGPIERYYWIRLSKP